MPDESSRFYDIAKNVATDLLRTSTSRTPEAIRDAAEKGVLVAKTLAGVSIAVEVLVAELRHLFSVEIEGATILEDSDPKGHVPWLAARKADISPRFWHRYMQYLERDVHIAPNAVNALDQLTDLVLDHLEDPSRDGPWDRRGMVVGSVQSGKTANYVGLICKALDSGYKLVIVLAGVHSNLRSQTQLRVDEGVLGFDTQKSRKLNKDSQSIGVGRVPGEVLHIHSLTTSADDGDFNKRVADTIGIMLGSDPVVLVVKKNARLLSNLLKWFHVAGKDNPATGRKSIREVPLLLIDDEADNASIDTGQKKGSPSAADAVSAINGKIRELIAAFEQSAYVGYTATPFANIFVDPEAATSIHGDDLFPRSFIVNVKPPSNYVGPTRVFGLQADVDAGIDGEDALPIVRPIADYDGPTCFPPAHKKGHAPTELPPSLKRAIRCFILACAARRARGQGAAHNSMLIHVTRFTDVQEKVVTLVRGDLMPLQRRLQFGDGARTPTLVDELRDLWETEFVPVSRDMRDDAGLLVSWEQVRAELQAAAVKIVVMTINGSAKEVLDYKNHEAAGLSVIAVGGDKLSRGLTLEGLSVSYFLRTSRMYDTLMQMGRWFGYRPGYLDLCRLFTTSQLVNWYRHIALAEVELKREFDRMVGTGRTPMDYGLRVRTHPDGMIVTALNKMGQAHTLTLSWSGVLVQTTHLPKDTRDNAHNFDVTERLLRELPQPQSRGDLTSKLWLDVPANVVADYIEELRLPPESRRAAGPQVAAFIRKQSTKNTPELTSWTVALVSNSTGEGHDVAGFKVGLIKRTPHGAAAGEASFPLKNANIISPKDQSLDLAYMPYSDAAVAAASCADVIADDVQALGKGSWANLEDLAVAITRHREATKRLGGNKNATVANGGVARELRPKTRGLLLIYCLNPADVKKVVPEVETAVPIVGLALSFPASDTAQGVEYQVNRVWDLELDDAAFED